MLPYNSQQISDHRDDGNGEDEPSSFFFAPSDFPTTLSSYSPPLLLQDLISFQTDPLLTDPAGQFPDLPPPQNLAVAEDVATMSTRKMSKNIVHREVERQRRKEMTTLHASLRDLLPLRFVKGKRAMSDHMQAALEYIKELQRRMEELGKKRDELKSATPTNYSGTTTTARADQDVGSSSYSYGSSSIVLVRPCLIGVEVTINIDGREDGHQQGGLRLSRVLELLMEQGLDVVTCDTVKVKDRLIHTLQSQVIRGSSCIDVAELQSLLTKAINVSK